MRDVKAYECGDGVILTVSCDGVEHLVHLYENEIDNKIIYGLNMGQVFQPREHPSFKGAPSAIEILDAVDERNWDFGAITLKSSDGLTLRIERNDESFPEPTFVVMAKERII